MGKRRTLITSQLLFALTFSINASGMSSKRLSVDPNGLFGRSETRTLTNKQNRRDVPFSSIGELIMTFKWGDRSSCSGTLIDSTHVLTAAHCVVDERNQNEIAEKIKFFPGRWGGLKPYLSSLVKRVYLPKNYLNGYPVGDDYAVLELKHKTRAATLEMLDFNEVTGLDDLKVCAIGYPVTGRTTLFGDIVENNHFAWASCGSVKDLVHADSALPIDEATLGSLLIISDGMSGGPVLAQSSNGQWKLVSVISRVGYDRYARKFIRNEGMKMNALHIEKIKAWVSGRSDSDDLAKDL